MSTSASIDALCNEIASRLPVLDRKIRQRELADVVREALAKGAALPARFLLVAAEYASRSDARRVRIDTLREQHARASVAERTGLIAGALREEGAPSRAFAALQRGWLDLDAMAERAELELHQLEVRRALALRAAAAVANPETAPEVRSSLLDLLPDLVITQPAPLCAVACAEALLELLTRVPARAEPRGRWEPLCAMLRETTPPRRVLAALMRLCLHAVPALAIEHLVPLLAREAGGDDFLLRQHALVLLTERGEDSAAFGMLAAKAQLGDPSEHVRIALPAALRATGGEAAVPLLESLAGAGSGPELGDRSPRVRAAATIALAELLRDRRAETATTLARLLADQDPLVYRITAEEIEDLALGVRLTEPEALLLSVAAKRRAEQAPITAQAEPALRALDALATITDPALGIARSMIERQLDQNEGAVVDVKTHVDPVTFGRLLAQFARDSFGLSAEPTADGYRVERGSRFVLRAWRLLHELRWRTPYKRQDGLHTIGRQLSGVLRAPPALLAEVTPTAVPGEPLVSPSDGTWGPQLPLVDDLLSMPIFGDEPVMLFTTRGITEIRPPHSLGARLRARMQLSTRYAALADLRLRALDPSDPSERTRYIEALEGLGFRITLKPYPVKEGATTTALVPAAAAPFARQAALSAVTGALMLPLTTDSLADFMRYVFSPAENTLGELGWAAAVVGGAMLASNVRKRQLIARDRAAIPLVIGGWGTRGKSGTERLKAGLLHALGVDVLVKTTGCEAMFIHGVPGRRPTEIFIHRSYDKATIWEQRDLLSLAARLRVSAFLWECMALSSTNVQVLSEEWMRDDLQTLTNAYPDHEDIQGPAGHDVARSIAGFIRSGGTVITSEEQMLPVLRDEAQRKGARLIELGGHDHLLLGEDLLARFPYREHPRNIALVRRLAVELGLDPDLATADMADHVVPDLGVLKVYPTVRYRDRRLSFVNGMSANERAGFMSNWQRMACEREVDQPGRWVVTVVNNRADRVARSKVFAEIVVRDASAERHVLIGTNLSGLRVYIDQAITHLLDELRLFRIDDPEAQMPALLTARFQRLRHRLRIGPAAPQLVLDELKGWLGGTDVGELLDEVTAGLEAARGFADAQEPLPQIITRLRGLPFARKIAELSRETGDELAHYACRSIARRALFASLVRDAERAIMQPSERVAVVQRQDRLYRELFNELVVVVESSAATGDQIIDTITSSCPPGVEATVMGIQNIKGTGLDFVYRWIRYDEVNTLVRRLARAEGTEARRLALVLTERSDFGMHDAALAADAVSAAAERLASDEDTAVLLRRCAAQLAEIAGDRRAALKAGGPKQGPSPVARALRKAFDTFDAVRRRWHSEAILDALVHHEISHERAALEARGLVEREKYGKKKAKN